MTEDLKKVFEWINGRDTGMSSQAICSHMVSGTSDGSYPYDPADLGRCLRLLEKFPHWKARLQEMEVYGPVWKLYLSRWEELHSMMDEEVGIDWSKARSAPRTYEFMTKLRKSIERVAS